MKAAPERGPAAPLFQTTDYQLPDARGHFGPYGGSFVAETLSHALAELSEAYAKYSHDPEFLDEFRHELKQFVGPPSPIHHARPWSEQTGRPQVYLQDRNLKPARPPQETTPQRPVPAPPFCPPSSCKSFWYR